MLQEVSNIINTLLRENINWRQKAPTDINSEDCLDFADAVLERVSDTSRVQIRQGPGHYFIEVRDRMGTSHYFDAEMPGGTVSVTNLPIYQREKERYMLHRDHIWVLNGWVPLPDGTMLPMPKQYTEFRPPYEASSVIGSPSFMAKHMDYKIQEIVAV